MTLEDCISSVECGVFSFINDSNFTIQVSNQYVSDLFKSAKKTEFDLKSIVLPSHFKELKSRVEQNITEKKSNFSYTMLILGTVNFFKWLDCRFFINESNSDEKIISCVCIDVSDLKNQCLSLKYENDILNLALQKTSTDVWKFDLATKTITLLSEKAKNTYSISVLENVPNVFVEKQYIHPDSLFPFLEMHEAIDRGEPFSEAEIRVKDTSGHYKWCRIKYVIIYDEETGSPMDAIGIGEDITAEKDVQLRTLMDFQYKEAMISDALCLFEVNLTRNLILKPDNRIRELLKGNYSMAFVGLVNDIANMIVLPEDKQKFLADFSREKLMDLFKVGKTKINFEYRVGKSLVDYYWIRVSINFILEPMQGDICALVYVQNITDTKVREQKLQSKAERDSLSKLYNRITTQKKAEKFLFSAENTGMSVLFMIDLDNFKQINDSLGHLYGDAVIIETAHRLKRIFRESDIIGRLGGDEFAIFIPNVPTMDFIIEKAKSISTAISAPVLFDNIPKSIGCSVGIAHTKEKIDFKTLYEMADKALYVAKSKGKNRFEFFSE